MIKRFLTDDDSASSGIDHGNPRKPGIANRAPAELTKKSRRMIGRESEFCEAVRTVDLRFLFDMIVTFVCLGCVAIFRFTDLEKLNERTH